VGVGAGSSALYLARGVPVLSRYLVVVLRCSSGWPGAPPSAGRVRGTRATRDTRAADRLACRGAGAGGERCDLCLLVVPQVTSFTRGMEASLVPLGRWLGAHAPADAQVATPDIGAIGYFSGRRVLDLGGLVTPRMVSLLEAAPFEEVLANFAFAGFARPAFVLDRAATAGDLLRRSPWGPP